MAGNSFKGEIQDSMKNPTKRPSQVKKEAKNATGSSNLPKHSASNPSSNGVANVGDGNNSRQVMTDSGGSNSGGSNSGGANFVGGADAPPPHHVAMAASIAHAILGGGRS